MGIHYQDRDIVVYKTSCGPYDNNCYLLVCRMTGESAIVDTPEDPGAVIEQAREADVKAILITHNHMDHLAGFDTVFGAHDVPVCIGTADGDSLDGKGVGEWIAGPDIHHVGELKIRAIHTPGHTPGSTCYAIDTEGGEHTLLLSGDTLFPGGPGRTGSPELFTQEVQSITGRLFPLPDHTVVLPGHGADTTIGIAKHEYGIFASRGHAEDLHGNVTWLGD
ncbi:MAG: MBL fold metallo-hydrolase [Dehalococcoidia bacterium]|jgi:glyoxylase-like metal-dependent hydrolase (beta-lactamase superfamily II)|nr:MBL fold metallo-hydrolase [Dehalococcoidia bacterium]